MISSQLSVNRPGSKWRLVSWSMLPTIVCMKGNLLKRCWTDAISYLQMPYRQNQQNSQTLDWLNKMTSLTDITSTKKRVETHHLTKTKASKWASMKLTLMSYRLLFLFLSKLVLNTPFFFFMSSALSVSFFPLFVSFLSPFCFLGNLCFFLSSITCQNEFFLWVWFGPKYKFIT